MVQSINFTDEDIEAIAKYFEILVDIERDIKAKGIDIIQEEVNEI